MFIGYFISALLVALSLARFDAVGPGTTEPVVVEDGGFHAMEGGTPPPPPCAASGTC